MSGTFSGGYRVNHHGVPLDDNYVVGQPGNRGRDVYVKINRMMAVEATVTEFFTDSNRYLYCTCDQYRAELIFCSHIQQVYQERMDVKDDMDPALGGVMPFEVDGQYATTVVIMAYKKKLTVDFKLAPYKHENNPDGRFVHAMLWVPDVDGDGSWANLGFVPYDVGRLELRSLFLEWITEIMVTDPDITCRQPWHQAWDELYPPDTEEKIFNAWMLTTIGICSRCVTDESIPTIYDPMRGALQRAREQRAQSRSAADNLPRPGPAPRSRRRV